jgi:hypothetical protein
MEKQRNAQQRGLRNFVKGDPRINRKGRPKGFDAFRRKAQEIACEMVTDSEGNKMTCVEALLRSWAKSSEPVLQRAFVEYAFGKVPDKLETNPLENKRRSFCTTGMSLSDWKTGAVCARRAAERCYRFCNRNQ